MSAVDAMQATGHDQQNGIGSIAALAKGARTGHPQFQNGKEKAKGGPPAAGHRIIGNAATNETRIPTDRIVGAQSPNDSPNLHPVFLCEWWNDTVQAQVGD